MTTSLPKGKAVQTAVIRQEATRAVVGTPVLPRRGPGHGEHCCAMAAGNLATYRSWLLKSDQAETSDGHRPAEPRAGDEFGDRRPALHSLQTVGSVVVPRPARTGMRYEAAIRGRAVRSARG